MYHWIPLKDTINIIDIPLDSLKAINISQVARHEDLMDLKISSSGRNGANLRGTESHGFVVIMA